MKKLIVAAFAFFSIAAGVLGGCDSSQSSTESATNPASELTAKCISLAKSYGYTDGQCAYSFIEACRTNSQKKIDAAYRADKMLGMGNYCPNMPSTYSEEFDKVF